MRAEMKFSMVIRYQAEQARPACVIHLKTGKQDSQDKVVANGSLKLLIQLTSYSLEQPQLSTDSYGHKRFAHLLYVSLHKLKVLELDRKQSLIISISDQYKQSIYTQMNMKRHTRTTSVQKLERCAFPRFKKTQGTPHLAPR